MEKCRALGGCPTGQAKITKGYGLPAQWVIHTVGPIWRGGQYHESEQLASCYQNCLELAAQNQIKTIAFPAISTGAYGFPVQRAAEIAFFEIQTFLSKNGLIEKVIKVCFDAATFKVYRKAFQLK